MRSKQGRRRSRVISRRQLERESRRNAKIQRGLTVVEEVFDRPCKRGDCVKDERPCPFVSCRHHLYLDVSMSGAIQVNFPDKEIWELNHTCALDIADRGGVSVEEIEKIMDLSRERIRQIEVSGFEKMKGVLRQ